MNDRNDRGGEATPPVPVLTGETESRARPWNSAAEVAGPPPLPDDASGALSVTYSPTVADVAVLVDLQTGQRPTVVRQLGWATAAILVVVVLLRRFVLDAPGRPRRPVAAGGSLADALFTSVLVPLCIFLVFWVFLLWLTRGPLRGRWFRKVAPGMFDQYTIRIDPTLFSRRNADEEVRTRWRAIRSVTRTPTHLIVATMNGGGSAIPRSVFDTPEQADAFFAAAERWHREAKP